MTKRTHVSTRIKVAAIVSAAFLAATMGAQTATAKEITAEDMKWRVRIGPGHISFPGSTKLSLGGVVVPGAGANIKNNVSLLAEVGYRFTPEWSAGLTIGIPPTTSFRGTGTAAAFGKLGRVTYAPAVWIVVMMKEQVLPDSKLSTPEKARAKDVRPIQHIEPRIVKVKTCPFNPKTNGEPIHEPQ